MAAYDECQFKLGDSMESLRSYLAIAVISCAMAVAAVPLMALTSSSVIAKEATAKKPKKEKKAKAKKGGGVTFHEGSGETRAERERRLTRECKGRSNSGLCEGFARP